MNTVRRHLDTLRRNRMTPYAAGAFTLMSPMFAHAQVAGGGGGGAGLFQTIIAWFQANVIVGLATVAIMVLGAGLLGGRFAAGAAVLVIIGLFVIGNAGTLAGLIPGLGG